MKAKSILKLLLVFLSFLPLGFAAFTCTKIYAYGGLENSFKMILCGCVIAAALLFAIFAILCYLKKMTKTACFVLVLALGFCAGNVYVSNLLSKVHDTLDQIATKEETYHGSIVVMSDSEYKKVEDLKGKKIGYFDLETSMEGYIVPITILEDAGIRDSVTLMPYEDLSYLINALYEGDVDAIMASASYTSTFEGITGFEDVGLETMIIADKEETQIIEVESEGTIEDLQKPFSVLFMGVDTNKPSSNGKLTGNADALFLATVNPTNYSINITSIPRDSYVPIMCYGDKRKDKITHANVGGTECVVSTVANMFDIEIDYFIKINFKGLEDLVDALDGVYITVDPEKYPNGLSEQNGKRYYEDGYKWIYVPPGTNKVSGEQALAFARCRKKLDGGATERASNQTMVINGIINELVSLNGVSKIYDVLDAVGSNVQTNLTVDQMTSFYKMGIEILERAKGMNMNNALLIDYYLVSGYDRRIYNESMEMMLYYYVPYEKGIESIKTSIHKNLGLMPYDIKTYFSYNQFENYYKDQAVFYKYDEKEQTFAVPDLVINMNGYTLDQAIAWANSRGIPYSINEIKEGHPSFDANYGHNTVIGHDQKVGRMTSKIKSITFDVIKIVKDEPVFTGDFDTILEVKHGTKDFKIPEIVVKDINGNKLEYTIHIALGEETVEKLDTKKSGTYTVTYKVMYKEKEYKKVKKIVVGPEPSASPSPSPSASPSPSPSSTPEQHTHTYVEVSRVESTCTSAGKVVKKCDCGSEIEEALEQLSHSYSETGRVDATCSSEGSITKQCSSCGNTIQETIAKLSHSYAEIGRVDATCDSAGSITKQCSGCGDTIQETIAQKVDGCSTEVPDGGSEGTE